MGTLAGWDIHWSCTQVCGSPVVGPWDGLWDLLSPNPLSLTSPCGRRSTDPSGSLFQQYQRLDRRNDMWHIPRICRELTIYCQYIEFPKKHYGTILASITTSTSVPALTSLTAHSPGGRPDLSPWGEMHSVAPTGLPLVFSTSTAHTASSTCSKNCSRFKTPLMLSQIEQMNDHEKKKKAWFSEQIKHQILD